MNGQQPERIQELARRIETLYSIPQILSRALRLARQPHVAIPDVVRLVRSDSALAADILRLANSALFRRGAPCSSLEEAVPRLGMREVLRAISLSLSRTVFGRDLAHYGITANQYWTESVWAALLMERLAATRGVAEAESYVIGLLRQIGCVLINEALSRVGENLLWDAMRPVEFWERERAGITHAEAGAILLRRWNFPEDIVDPLASQLEPATAAEPDSARGLLRFARLCLISADPAGLWRSQRAPLPQLVLQWFGIGGARELRDLVEETTRQVEVVRQNLA